jgi:hypothetical protein
MLGEFAAPNVAGWNTNQTPMVVQRRTTTTQQAIIVCEFVLGPADTSPAPLWRYLMAVFMTALFAPDLRYSLRLLRSDIRVLCTRGRNGARLFASSDRLL